MLVSEHDVKHGKSMAQKCQLSNNPHLAYYCKKIDYLKVPTLPRVRHDVQLPEELRSQWNQYAPLIKPFNQ